jgi:large subunit ribosomal protein L13
MRTVEFDANGKILGRLATQIANALRGKDQPSFRPDRMPDVEVIVKNADKVKVSGEKLTQKFHYHFSGYPGGLRKTALGKVLADHPERVLQQAVKRMLPKNRLQARFMKRLKLEMSK